MVGMYTSPFTTYKYKKSYKVFVFKKPRITGFLLVAANKILKNLICIMKVYPKPKIQWKVTTYTQFNQMLIFLEKKDL